MQLNLPPPHLYQDNQSDKLSRYIDNLSGVMQAFPIEARRWERVAVADGAALDRGFVVLIDIEARKV